MAGETEVYVRYCDTDVFGHVNNTSYFLYLEEGRTKFFSELCPKRPDSLNFIIASITCDYIEQAYPSETLKVITRVVKIGMKSFHLEQTIRNEVKDLVIAKATAVIVCFNYKEERTIPIPKSLRADLESRLA